MDVFWLSALLVVAFPKFASGVLHTGQRRESSANETWPSLTRLAGPDVWKNVTVTNESNVTVNFTKSVKGRKVHKHKANFKRVLLVDNKGPIRLHGEGVRIMSMINDLESDNCNYEVHLLSNYTYEEYQVVLGEWDPLVQTKYIDSGNLHLRKPTSLVESGGAPVSDNTLNLQHFDWIILGAKLDLLTTDEHDVVKRVVATLEESETNFHARTSVFWDDMPFERCKVKPEASTCEQVPMLVQRFALLASQFFMLTSQDQDAMMMGMQTHRIRHSTKVRVWPMWISNLRTLMPSQGFSPPTRDDEATKDLVVMMGVEHPVNRRNLERLFNTGAMSMLCDDIKARNSSVSFLFLGSLTRTVGILTQGLMDRGANMDCVNMRPESVSEIEINDDILPRTRAILNPFFIDVHSGISVKTFEAIKDGFPFITSAYGLNGLQDIDGCDFPLPAHSSSLIDFAAFFMHNVVDPTGYLAFMGKFKASTAACTSGQMSRWPMDRVCSYGGALEVE